MGGGQTEFMTCGSEGLKQLMWKIGKNHETASLKERHKSAQQNGQMFRLDHIHCRIIIPYITTTPKIKEVNHRQITLTAKEMPPKIRLRRFVPCRHGIKRPIVPGHSSSIERTGRQKRADFLFSGVIIGGYISSEQSHIIITTIFSSLPSQGNPGDVQPPPSCVFPSHRIKASSRQIHPHRPSLT